MRRNSFLPLIMTALVAFAAYLLIPAGDGMGADGPELFSGILRLPKNQAKMVPSATLAVEQSVHVTVPATRVPGLEPDAWRVVTIANDDGLPLTRAVTLALAEELTKRGAVAVIDAFGQAPLPMPADRVLRVATLSADQPGERPRALNAIIRIRQEPIALPAGHPAVALQGASGVPVFEFTIAHRSEPDTSPPRWATWYAGVGRAVASAALEPLGVAVDLPSEWDRPRVVVAAVDQRRYRRPGFLWLLVAVPLMIAARWWAWRRLPVDHPTRARRFAWLRPVLLAGGLIAGALLLADPVRGPAIASPSVSDGAWAKHLPIPPQMEVLRWSGACEDDLVRGWTGRVIGKTTFDRASRPIPAIQPVLKLLAKYDVEPGTESPVTDRWQEQSAPGSAVRTFARHKDGAEELFSIAEDATGWDCVLWQELTRPATEIDQWTTAATEPDTARAARRRLRRHLLSPRLPADQFAEAVAVLRRDPDAAEVAMLAETSVATEGEKRFAHAARWCLGREAEPPSVTDAEPPWKVVPLGMPVVMSSRPCLLQVGESYILVLAGAKGAGLVIARSAAGSARKKLTTEVPFAMTLPGGGTLTITPTGNDLEVVAR